MKVKSSKFGIVEFQAADVIIFPLGLVGKIDCQHWILLSDQKVDYVAWLQCIDDPGYCIASVTPRRFVPEYQLRIPKSEMDPLHIKSVSESQVLAVVGKNDSGMTLNLKAPLVINPVKRLGRQVIVNGDWDIQYELNNRHILRKSA